MPILPQFQTDDKDFQLMQNKWGSILNALLRNPLVNGVQLTDLSLLMGDNVINTKLGKRYQGYIITGMRDAYAEIYEVPSVNESINITLNASAATTIDLYVF